MATIDLRKDLAEIQAYLVDRIRGFDPDSNDGPGEPGPVAMIEFGFEASQGPTWVSLVFDTRPDAEPDGDWTEYIEDNWLERPEWSRALDAWFDEEEPLTLIHPDGRTVALGPEDAEGDDEPLCSAVGEMLKGILLKAKADGLFDALPRAAECHVGVEENNGAYGWPVYEDRGKEDLI